MCVADASYVLSRVIFFFSPLLLPLLLPQVRGGRTAGPHCRLPPRPGGRLDAARRTARRLLRSPPHLTHTRHHRARKRRERDGHLAGLSRVSGCCRGTTRKTHPPSRPRFHAPRHPRGTRVHTRRSRTRGAGDTRCGGARGDRCGGGVAGYEWWAWHGRGGARWYGARAGGGAAATMGRGGAHRFQISDSCSYIQCTISSNTH